MIKDADILRAAKAALLNTTDALDRVFAWKVSPENLSKGPYINIVVTNRRYESNDSFAERYKEFRDLVIMIVAAGNDDEVADTDGDGVIDLLDTIEEQISNIFDRDTLPNLTPGIQRMLKTDVRTEREEKDRLIGLRFITYEILTKFVPKLRSAD